MTTPTFWKKAEWFPPIICRLLARSGPFGAPLTDDALAERSGLPLFTVAALSQQTDWRGVDLPTMRKWLEACGTDFENPEVYHRLRTYLRGKRVQGHRMPPQFTYLRTSPRWATFYAPLHQRYLQSRMRKP